MHRRPAALTGSLLASGALAVALAGPAAAVCEAYSGGCTEPPGVLPTTLTDGTTDSTTTTTNSTSNRVGAGTPSTLPFTGGEVVLVSVAGAAAIAGGGALVVAGRRRASSG